MRKILLIIGNFGKPLNLFFRIKSNLNKEPIILVKNDNIEPHQIEVAKTFSSSVKNLEIPEYQCEDNLNSRLSSNPVLQAIIK